MRAKQIASLGIALLLAAATPAAVYASTDITKDISSGTHVIEGNIDYSGDDNALHVEGNGTEVTVKGDVRSEKGQNPAVSTKGSSSLNVGGSIESDKGTGLETNDKSQVSIGKDIKAGGTGIDADNESKVTVGRDVVSGGTGIKSDGSADVTVNGSIESGGTGIDANNKSSVSVKGDVISDNVRKDMSAVKATGGASVTVEGNVKAEDGENNAWTIDATGGSTVDIKGNLEIKNGEGIWASGNITEVTVDGTIKADGVSTGRGFAADAWSGAVIKADEIDTDGSGAAASGGGTVMIEGDVISGSGPDRCSVGLYGENSTVLIGGDVSTNDDGEMRIDVMGKGDSGELAVGGSIDNTGGLMMKVDTSLDSEGNLVNIPEIVIGEITDPDNIRMIDGNSISPTFGAEVPEEIKEKVLDSIKYIVNTNPDSMEGKGAFTITKLNGDSLSRDKSDKYDVTTKTERILVRISVTDGYEVGSFSAGKNNTYVRNADGSYTVTVADGGGINIEALIKAIERDPDPVKPAPIDSGSGSSSGNSRRGGSSHTGGTWSGSGAGLTFTKVDGSLAGNEWVDINVNGKVNRYFFGADGKMMTGWYTDASGSRYYLNETLGSDHGAMCTGWKLIDGKWYYLMPYTTIMSGIKRNAGSMMRSTVTPDGYKVDADGVWIE